jgi:hypothetical protein
VPRLKPVNPDENISAQDSGGLSTAEPPGPIPNPEVKRCSADGSIAKGYARVGRCQVINYHPKQLGWFFYAHAEIRREHSCDQRSHANYRNLVFVATDLLPESETCVK